MTKLQNISVTTLSLRIKSIKIFQVFNAMLLLILFFKKINCKEYSKDAQHYFNYYS
jgi:hypothetical protein